MGSIFDKNEIVPGLSFMPEDPLVEIVSSIDDAISDHEQAVKTYQHMPTKNNRQEIYKTDSLLSDVFVQSSEQVYDQDLLELQQANIISSFIIRCQQSYLGLLSDIGDVNSQDILFHKHQDLSEEIKELIEDEDYDEINEIFGILHSGNLKLVLNSIDSTRRARLVGKAEVVSSQVKKIAPYAGAIAVGYFLNEIVQK